MERIWFRKTTDELLWKPVTWQGWSVSALWVLSLLWHFIKVDAFSHSASDTLINAAPFFIIATLVFLIVVRKTSGRRWE